MENAKHAGFRSDKLPGEIARAKDYGHASPEEIMADIERTRAHMDETLHLLGSRLTPKVSKKALGIALGSLAAGLLGLLVYRLARGRKHESVKQKVKRRAGHWRDAGILEQATLAGKLALAARKGKPAIIVVEPRKV